MATTSEITAARIAPVGTIIVSSAGEKIVSTGGGNVRIEGQPTAIDIAKQQMITETKAAVAAGQTPPPGAAIQGGHVVYGAFEVQEGKTIIPADVVRTPEAPPTMEAGGGKTPPAGQLTEHELMALGFTKTGTPGPDWEKGDYYDTGVRGYDVASGRQTRQLYRAGRVYTVTDQGQGRGETSADVFLRDQGLSVSSRPLNETPIKFTGGAGPDEVRYAGKTIVVVTPEKATTTFPGGKKIDQTAESGSKIDVTAAERKLKDAGFETRMTNTGILIATRREEANVYYEQKPPVYITRTKLEARPESREETYGRGIERQLQGIKDFTGIQAFETFVKNMAAETGERQAQLPEAFEKEGALAKLAGQTTVNLIAELPGQLAVVPLFVKEAVTNPLLAVENIGRGSYRVVSETGMSLATRPVETLVVLGTSLLVTSALLKGLNITYESARNIAGPKAVPVTKGVGESTTITSLPDESGNVLTKSTFKTLSEFERGIFKGRVTVGGETTSAATTTTGTAVSEGQAFVSFTRQLKVPVVYYGKTPFYHRTIMSPGEVTVTRQYPFVAETVFLPKGESTIIGETVTKLGNLKLRSDFSSMRVVSEKLPLEAAPLSPAMAQKLIDFGAVRELFQVRGYTYRETGGGAFEFIIKDIREGSLGKVGSLLSGPLKTTTIERTSAGGAMTQAEQLNQLIGSSVASASTGGLLSSVFTRTTSAAKTLSSLVTVTGLSLGLIPKIRQKETTVVVPSGSASEIAEQKAIVQPVTKTQVKTLPIEIVIPGISILPAVVPQERQGQRATTIQEQSVMEFQIQRQIQTTAQTGATPSVFVPTFQGFQFPLIGPQPPEFGGYQGEKKRKRSLKVKKIDQYVPSLSALVFGIDSSKTFKELNRAVLTGVEVRPIPAAPRRKK